jgi:hypothetical protein
MLPCRPWQQAVSLLNQHLVKEHLQVSDKLAAGLRALLDTNSSFASTQAAWRFYRNEQMCLPVLTHPLLVEAHKGVTERFDSYALAVANWSAINFGKHQNKTDRQQSTPQYDVGYELPTSLWLNDPNGEPLAPIVQNLVTQEGVWSSYHDERIQLEPHLDELTPRMKWITGQPFAKPVVHLIDRETASIDHQREWDEAGFEFVWHDQAGSTVKFNQRQVEIQSTSSPAERSG